MELIGTISVLGTRIVRPRLACVAPFPLLVTTDDVVEGNFRPLPRPHAAESLRLCVARARSIDYTQ